MFQAKNNYLRVFINSSMSFIPICSLILVFHTNLFIVADIGFYLVLFNIIKESYYIFTKFIFLNGGYGGGGGGTHNGNISTGVDEGGYFSNIFGYVS